MKKAGTAPEPKTDNPPLFFVEAVRFHRKGIKVEPTTRRMFIPNYSKVQIKSMI